jgi:hypothetical protein
MVRWQKLNKYQTLINMRNIRTINRITPIIIRHSSWLESGAKSLKDTVSSLDVVTPVLTQTMNEMKGITADMSKKYLQQHDEVTITSSFSVGLVTMTITVKDKKKD